MSDATCPHTTAFTPLPIRTRVEIPNDGARGTIAGYDYPGLFPHPETVRYLIDLDDGNTTHARHDELALADERVLRLVASDGRRVGENKDDA